MPVGVYKRKRRTHCKRGHKYQEKYYLDRNCHVCMAITRKKSQERCIAKNPNYLYDKVLRRRAANPEKFYARVKLSDHIVRGKIIKPKSCSKCHKKCNPHGHHEDYSKPLEVIWVCQECHLKIHGKKLWIK